METNLMYEACLLLLKLLGIGFIISLKHVPIRKKSDGFFGYDFDSNDVSAVVLMILFAALRLMFMGLVGLIIGNILAYMIGFTPVTEIQKAAVAIIGGWLWY